MRGVQFVRKLLLSSLGGMAHPRKAQQLAFLLARQTFTAVGCLWSCWSLCVADSLHLLAAVVWRKP